jgi:disulfide bond formation protein DsbB
MSAVAARNLNIVALLGLSALLAVAFAYQLVLGELPCPLCLLQRMAFVAAGVGVALNIVIGPRPAHYGMIIVSAALGMALSGRQILLHIVPGTGAYGSPLLGLHFYTWAFIGFAVMVLAAGIMLLLERQFEPQDGRERLRGAAAVAVYLFLAMALANAFSTVAECELGLCPDDPTEYLLFSRLRG